MNEWTHEHQLEIKSHISELAEIQKRKFREFYDKSKREFVKQNLEKRKREITKALLKSIKKFENVIKEMKSKAEKINYGSNYDFDYKAPKIEEEKIESSLRNEFERKNESKKESSIERIEQKRLQAIEKVLFCEAKKQQQIIKELREMKIEL